VPALNARREDIPALVDTFIRLYSEKFGVQKYIDDDAKEYLQKHDWPGNIRELENVVQRLIITCKGSTITIMDVMKDLHGESIELPEFEMAEDYRTMEQLNLAQMVENFEKNIIKYACEKYGSTRKAAKAIGISQTQLVRKKNKYQIQ
jgi:TyrR family helix-turn-helix protein